VISDEIYHGLTYDGARAQTLLTVDPEAVIVNSFSKYFSMPGWRLGWLVVPPALVDQARARMGNLFLTPPVLSQNAGLVAFDCREELEGHVAAYARNRNGARCLARARPGADRPPDGAFYVWADIGHLTDDSMAFCLKLLEDTGVATAPGIDFDPVEGNRFFRISFAVSGRSGRRAGADESLVCRAYGRSRGVIVFTVLAAITLMHWRRDRAAACARRRPSQVASTISGSSPPLPAAHRSGPGFRRLPAHGRSAPWRNS
jgi:aspartate/methionine/tyrosine aminotransferase